MPVKAVPEGWHTVTPRLFVSEAAKLVDFLKHAFGATGEFRNDGPTEARIGDSIVMVSAAGVREAMRLSSIYIWKMPIEHIGARLKPARPCRGGRRICFMAIAVRQ